ncbi:CbtA family protein [Actinomadura rupiterrae]|uniref:CbtA family protein n=1 Tax=Actinomadura rupiterrae TaxID=559627 RepID=UPI0020A2E677|nr:CbtA family protein [Actinomadura rupiterrae]MCP2339823.1 putative cobalt transporter CbtA [Actinomadura rupiterrae]
MAADVSAAPRPMTMRSLLVRGMLVGMAGAALALVVAWIYGEPQVGNAIAFEEAHSEHAGHEPEVVSRAVQKSAGLITAVGFYGVAIGGLFAIAFAFAYGRLGSLHGRATAALVGLLGFVAVEGVPFLKYPATPPAVGNPSTIGSRTALYFGMIAIGLATVVAAVIVCRRLAPRLGTWNAVTLSAIGFVLVNAVLFQITPKPDAIPEHFPAETLWDFRIASLGMQAVLWATLGLLFGWLTERSLRK